VQNENLLEVFDKLIETNQRSKPGVVTVRFEVGDYLLGNPRPLVRIVALNYRAYTRSQLDPVTVSE